MDVWGNNTVDTRRTNPLPKPRIFSGKRGHKWPYESDHYNDGTNGVGRGDTSTRSRPRREALEPHSHGPKLLRRQLRHRPLKGSGRRWSHQAQQLGLGVQPQRGLSAQPRPDHGRFERALRDALLRGSSAGFGGPQFGFRREPRPPLHGEAKAYRESVVRHCSGARRARARIEHHPPPLGWQQHAQQLPVEVRLG